MVSKRRTLRKSPAPSSGHSLDAEEHSPTEMSGNSHATFARAAPRERRRSSVGLSGKVPKDSPLNSPTKPQSAATKAANVLLANEAPSKKWQNWWIRTVTTFMMIGGFFFVLAAGHMWVILCVFIISSMVYREVIALAQVPSKEKKLPWFKTLNWYFLISTNYFLYGESIIYYFKQVIMVDSFLGSFATHHRFISFILYVIGFVFFVSTLRKGHYKFQFAQFCWTHMALLLVVVQSHFIVNNIFEGLIWFVLPVSLVICNDIFAYVCGFFYGKTPLIKLSPKKTVEGFVGGWICTLIFAVLWVSLLMRWDYMICPVKDLGASAWSHMTCENKNPVFSFEPWALPPIIAGILQKLTHKDITYIWIAPVQLHAIMMACFASLIAPFGGFFASGVKRAFKIKDFGDSIPGHGGLTDRMDCQFLMGLFSYMYYQSFIKTNTMNVGNVLTAIITNLSHNEQLQLLERMHAYMADQGILDAATVEKWIHTKQAKLSSFIPQIIMSPRFRSRKNVVLQLNVMVVGKTKLGKTSFLRTLCQTLTTRPFGARERTTSGSSSLRDTLLSPKLSSDIWSPTPQAYADAGPEASEPNPALIGPVQPTTESYSMSFEIEEQGERILLTFVDTPGFVEGYESEKQMWDILHYLEYQFDITLIEESKVRRNPKAMDSQVHVCLYFIDPTQPSLSELDTRVLKKLTTRVNVIPVIAKADLLTTAQKKNLKEKIWRDIFEKEKIEVYGFPEADEDETEEEYDDEDEDEEKEDFKDANETTAGAGEEQTNGNGHGEIDDTPSPGTDIPATPTPKIFSGLRRMQPEEINPDDLDDFDIFRQLLPFSVIAYEENEDGTPLKLESAAQEDVPYPQYGRQYPWGTIQVYNPNHSDLGLLRAAILSTHRNTLKSNTVEHYYEAYRSQRLMARKSAKLTLRDTDQILTDLQKI
ncbi:hypothetical protein BZG36_00245 [Bifiguratus adelaidae]|uniref:Phosphatidate cytidylyltransferase n=1 Tax=Bifiguratus adelaidae TaxID=1938954 RepID=A0A261Y8R5_9FUNG|nr:hypothetical protein BZG36_00245 [Bifiguratus adelaidae]